MKKQCFTMIPILSNLQLTLGFQALEWQSCYDSHLSFCTLHQARHETFGRLNAELGLVPMGTSGSAGVFVNPNLFSTGKKKKKHVENRAAHLKNPKELLGPRIFHNPPQPKTKPHSEARTSQGLSPRGTREQKGEVEDFHKKNL